MNSEEDSEAVCYRDATSQTEEVLTDAPSISLARQLESIQSMMDRLMPHIMQGEASNMFSTLEGLNAELARVISANTSDRPLDETGRPSSVGQSNPRGKNAQTTASASAGSEDQGTSDVKNSTMTNRQGARGSTNIADEKEIPTSGNRKPNRQSGRGSTDATDEKEMFVRQRDGTLRRITLPEQNATTPANSVAGGSVSGIEASTAPTMLNPGQRRPTGLGARRKSTGGGIFPVMPRLKRDELPAKLQELIKQLRGIELGRDPWQCWPAMDQLRNEFFMVLLDSMCRKMKYVQESNIENIFWREHCHAIVDRIRTQMKETTDSEEEAKLRCFLYVFLEDNRSWFVELLEQLQEKYSFKLVNYIGKYAGSYTSGLKHSLALVSAQKLSLFVGDTCRYQLEVYESSPPDAKGHPIPIPDAYNTLKRIYIMAREIIPKNSRPYNQLALLAIRDRKFFDAVYLYSRCLMASNPFQSAWDGLLDLFNTARKKVSSGQTRQRCQPQRNFEATRAEQEAILQAMVTESNDDDQQECDRTPVSLRSEMADFVLGALPASRLQQQFYHSFVHLVGMIATKTGMEAFTQCAEQVLREFQQLLTTIFYPDTRLLEISLLLMFAMEKAKQYTKVAEAD
uniref:DNA/RNA-binding domain-containing protein n=1 Tax=Anopheles albimanus TaxID=7167 RepID=A0A182FJ62_ANOAL